MTEQEELDANDLAKEYEVRIVKRKPPILIRWALPPYGRKGYYAEFRSKKAFIPELWKDTGRNWIDGSSNEWCCLEEQSREFRLVYWVQKRIEKGLSTTPMGDKDKIIVNELADLEAEQEVTMSGATFE